MSNEKSPRIDLELTEQNVKAVDLDISLGIDRIGEAWRFGLVLGFERDG